MTASRRITITVTLALALNGLGAAAAMGAPPVISGTDGQAWSTAPTYDVAVGPEAVRVEWTASNGQTGAQTSLGTGFTIRLTRPFPEGPATLTVVQRNRGDGPRDEEATRRFVIDTTAPGAVLVAAPASVGEGAAFDVSWSGGEPGATYVWSVVTPGPAGDTVVQGPAETTAGGARIPGLPPGGHRISVVQRDAAGNVGPPAALALAVVATAPPAPAPPPLGTPPAPPATPAGVPAPAATPKPAARRAVIRLPSQRASRLRPRRAATIRSVRPILRWTRGAKGTRLYNVQLFRVPSVRPVGGVRALKLRKVGSAFPRTNRVRAPRLVRGACYVWRVWPYRGAGFTRQPIGVSHFCVARKAAARR